MAIFFFSVWAEMVSAYDQLIPTSGPARGWNTIAEWSPITSVGRPPRTGIPAFSR
jgi:hypothetical protein